MLKRLCFKKFALVFCLCFFSLTKALVSAIDCTTNNLQILESLDEKTLRSVLLEEIPFFEVSSIKIISCGWDNWVADVNNEWIFRFPRKKSVAENLFRENLLLDKLHPLAKVCIPRYEIKGNKFCFVAYRKIHGIELSKECYEKLNEDERRSLAELIANFLFSLHHLFTVDEAEALGFSKNLWPINWLKYDLAENLPSPDWEKMFMQALKEGEEILHNNPSYVLGHHDLHGGNMAFNPTKKNLEGIFDFSDASIGIIYRDFSELISIHYKLAEDVSRIYFSHSRHFEKIDDVLRKVGIDYQLRKFTCLLCAIENCEQTRYHRILKELNEFSKSWKY